jgi:CRP-like cAMP-binding protein
MPDTKKSEEITRFLVNVPLFCSLPVRHLKKFADRFHENHYKAGEVIVKQGSPGIGLYIVYKGHAKVTRHTDEGSDVELDMLQAGSFFGEISLLDGSERSATVTALDDVTCLALRKYDFLDEISEEPEIAIEMLKEMGRRFRRIVSRI